MELFVHVGYPKTATTMLQRNVFPCIDGVEYLGLYGDARDKECIAERLQFLLANRWVSFFEKNTSFLDDELNGFFVNSKGRYLLSSEKIVSASFHPFGVWPVFLPAGVGPDPYVTLIKLAEIAKRKNVFIKILVTIRRQDHLLLSYIAEEYPYYKSYFPKKTAKHVVNFLLGKGRYMFLGNALNYNYVIGGMEEFFGRENVCVLVYEDLKFHSDNFMEKMGAFLGRGNVPR